MGSNAPFGQLFARFGQLFGPGIFSDASVIGKTFFGFLDFLIHFAFFVFTFSFFVFVAAVLVMFSFCVKTTELLDFAAICFSILRFRKTNYAFCK